MIHIHPYEQRYKAAVAQLIVPIQQEEFGIAISYEQQPDLQDISGFYQHGTGNFWIALTPDENVVGTIALLDIGNSEAALRKMFVAADYRGSPHRAGSQLLETLLTHAKQQKLRGIYLGTTDKFLAAHRFYEKSGFARLAPEDLPVSFPRMQVDSIFYHLPIKPD